IERSAWPTLGEMISSGKPVVLWENPFSVTNSSFPCKVDRSAGPLSTVEHLSLINYVLNFKIIPIGDGLLISA
ncbi:hypothetical protein BD779DRAFT_1447225, partial [Infundibulicybe gibba]